MSLEQILFGYWAIERSTDYNANWKSIDKSDKILSDKELVEWWKQTHTKDQKEYDDQNFIDVIFNQKYKIALDASCLGRKYLNKIMKINLDNLPKDWSEEQCNEFRKKYCIDDINARELKSNHPQIFELGYVTKVKINNILITNIILEPLDNKITVESDDGFTLNEIAYLATNFFKMIFWYTNHYRREACIFMYIKKHLNENILNVGVGCDT